MLLGLNETLEKVMASYRSESGDTDRRDVLDAIVNALAAGDDWYVPVDCMEEGSNETDFEEGRVLEKLPEFVKRTLTTSGEKQFLCAFTSLERVHDDGEKELLSVRYPAKDLLTEFAETGHADAFMLNPWSDDFVLSREDARTLLSMAASVSPEDVLLLRRYSLEPKAVIDTNSILASWREGWNDGDCEQERWRDVCCPIMADGRILLLFEMIDEIEERTDGQWEVTHINSHYRVLEYQLGAEGLKLIGRYRFSAQDGNVSTVFLYDGELKASIRHRGSRSETILPMIPTNDDKQFKIYENVNRIVSRKNGDIVVGYHSNMYDKYRLPLMVFDAEGAAIQHFKSEDTLFCSELCLDSEENIWFHMYPSGTIDRLIPGTSRVESHGVALQHFDSLALSDDLSRLFLGFDEYGAGSVHYILTRDRNGNYVDPVRFDFRPKDDSGEEMVPKDKYWPCSTMKSWVIIKADGRLYLYDINDEG